MKVISNVSKAVWVRTNIRFIDTVSIERLVGLLKGDISDTGIKDHFYILAFFEEVYPSLMKKFMAEFSISREQILRMYDIYEEHGEMRAFRKALENGKF